MIGYLNYNGEILSASQPLITADNRGFRYGDGLFETMKMNAGSIQLAEWHFDRLFEGLRLLGFEQPSDFTPAFLTDAIRALARRNYLERSCRVRLMVFRGGGSLLDPDNHTPNFIIEVSELPDMPAAFPSRGLVIDIFGEARKTFDCFSHLKTNNYLPYLLAANHAKKRRLHDALVLNAVGNLCESTIANVFIISDEQIITPPLSSGCVAGVVRRLLLERLPLAGFDITERAISPADLLQCDEIFLTNSLAPIRPVEQCGTHTYGHLLTEKIFHAIIPQIG